MEQFQWESTQVSPCHWSRDMMPELSSIVLAFTWLTSMNMSVFSDFWNNVDGMTVITSSTRNSEDVLAHVISACFLAKQIAVF